MTKLLSTVKHYAVHAFGLALSLSAIFHTMTSFSDALIFKAFFGAGGIYAGLSIQYLRGLAAAYKRRGSKKDIERARGLWVIVLACILVFDFLSSFSVLNNQISTGDQQYAVLVERRQTIRADIESLRADIREKKAQQKAEFADKGRGPRYNAFEVEIEAKEESLARLKNDLAKVTSEMEAADKSFFVDLSEKSGIPSFWIEFTMCAALMFLVYFVPLLTPWNVTIPGEQVTSNGVTSNTVTGGKVTTVTRNETAVTAAPHKVTTVTCNEDNSGNATCIVCGGPTGGGMYCSGKCRTAEFRRRQKAKEG